MTGALTVTGGVSGDLSVRRLEGEVSIGGDLTVGVDSDDNLDGTVSIGGAMSGAIDVAGDIGSTASVEIGESSWDDVTGTIAVHGDLAGDIHLYNGLEDPLGYATGGQIAIDGSLLSSGDIDIDGLLEGTTTFVTIDHHGYDSGDDWVSPAVVCVGDPNECYTENTPAERIYEVTCQKGDSNNDGAVDNADIYPFTWALEGAISYCGELPGLCGSMLYHHDMDCDGEIEDIEDWNAFQLRLSNPQAYYARYPDCEECPGAGEDGGSFGEAPTAGEFAAILIEAVPPERLPFAVYLCEQAADAFADTERGEFWAAVAEALTP